jgi:predicted phosphodiesterase
MRLAVVSDIHANLPALTAVREALAAERLDACVCAGDLVGYGPQPNECVELVAELGWTCVVGNHDLIALGSLTWERCIPIAQRTLAWTRDVMTEATRSALRALPDMAEVGPLVVTHGGLGDPERYVKSDADAATELRVLAAEHPEASLLVLGHTHHPFAYAEGAGALLRDRSGVVELPEGGRALLNPGSVGQTRVGGPTARFAIVDTEARRAEFHVLDYDVRAVRRALRRTGLPANAHAPYHPPAYRRAAGRLRRRLRTLR